MTSPVDELLERIALGVYHPDCKPEDRAFIRSLTNDELAAMAAIALDHVPHPRAATALGELLRRMMQPGAPSR